MAEWFAAVSKRRSRRTYDGHHVDARLLDTLAEACEGFRPYPDARVELIPDPGADVFTGIMGSYGKVSGAPHVLVVIADTASRESQQHAGYAGEAAILEATVLGLDTCWVGGFFDQRKATALVELTPTERIVAVSPVGHATAAMSGTDKTMRGMAGSHRRKPLEQIAEGVAAWPAWAQAAAECARLAPSAVNRQPWRLRLDDTALVVARDNALETPKVTKSLDCGIAMLHAELGARSVGTHGRWTPGHGGLEVARFIPEETS